MRKSIQKTFIIIFWFITSFSFSQDVNKILLIGDSITKGTGSINGKGYRDDLYNMLLQEDYSFEFVGKVEDGDNLRGHFYPGSYIREFYLNPDAGGSGEYDVAESMIYEPHIIILHLGTNDVSERYYSATPYRNINFNLRSNTSSGRLAHLISYLSKWHDGTFGDHLHTIYVSSIITNFNDPDKTQDFNKQVEKMVKEANLGLLSSIPPDLCHFVDQYELFQGDTLINMSDYVHPNEPGYTKIAQIYFDELRFLPMHFIALNGYTFSGDPHTLFPNPIYFQILNGYGEPVSDIPITLDRVSGDALFFDGGGSTFVGMCCFPQIFFPPRDVCFIFEKANGVSLWDSG